MKQNIKLNVYGTAFSLLKCCVIPVLLGDVAFDRKSGYINHERSESMFVIAVVVCLLLFVALASADLLIANINSDELNNMGVEKKS